MGLRIDDVDRHGRAQNSSKQVDNSVITDLTAMLLAQECFVRFTKLY
jgi:hypothetical protein